MGIVITKPLNFEPFSMSLTLLTLTGITRFCPTSTSTLTTTSGTATSTSDAIVPLRLITIVYTPPDADSPPTPDIVQDFKAATTRLLEHFA